LNSVTALPPLFLSHGSPTTATDPREAGAFWSALGPVLEHTFGRPRAILAVSGHSLTREPVLLAAPRHDTVHDFSGFPAELYTLRYDAPGDPRLATRVETLLREAGLPVHRVDDGGLDHGIWVPLKFIAPQADIPVLPLAWPPQWTPAQLFTLGAALAPLSADGVLVVGTGAITHNLRRVFAHGRTAVDQPATPQSTAFRDWFVQRSAARDWDALFAYRTQAPHAALMHPTDEHLLPWYVATGAGGREHAPRRIHASLTFGDLGMDAYAFGAGAAALEDALAAQAA
jgi:4,5-DOPA dioxygenase extradiol